MAMGLRTIQRKTGRLWEERWSDEWREDKVKETEEGL